MLLKLIPHVLQTLIDILVSVSATCVIIAIVCTIMTIRSPSRRMILPLAKIMSLTPFVVLIPIMTIWRGTSYFTMIMLVCITCAMPMITSITKRLWIRDQTVMEYLLTLKASKRTIFWSYQLPHSVPGVIGALKIALQLGTISVLVIQMQSSSVGLGHLILQATYSLQYPLLIGACVASMILGRTLSAIPRGFSRLFHRYLAYRE